MKRSRDKDSETLTAYLQSAFAQSARYTHDTQCFQYVDEKGVPRQAAGLLSFLRTTYYPHYVEGVVPLSGKAWKHGKPSNVEQGIRVDNDMEALARGRTDGLHPLSAALLAHWQAKGHSVVAAQVPVRIDAWRMTRADVITRHDLTGKLWLWEVKTGMSASLRDKQGTMRSIPGTTEVPCNKANCWQLQCEYTRRALVEQAELPIAGARVIQVYESRKRGAAIEVKEHRTAPWLKQVK